MKYELNIENMEKVLDYLNHECPKRFIGMIVNEEIYNFIKEFISENHSILSYHCEIPCQYEYCYRYILVVDDYTLKILKINKIPTSYYSYQKLLDIIVKEEIDNMKVRIMENDMSKKREDNMLKILKIYQDKKEAEIEYKYDTQLEELKKDDPIQKIISETNDKITEILKADNEIAPIHANSCRIDYSAYTTRTLDKEKEIIKSQMQEKNKLYNKIHEIEALLELAPNYEEKMQILRDYDIIDKKKNIVL